jgi:hypothetical protein
MRVESIFHTVAPPEKITGSPMTSSKRQREEIVVSK